MACCAVSCFSLSAQAAGTSFASPSVTYERDGWLSARTHVGLGWVGGRMEFSSLFRQETEEDRHPLLRERAAQEREDQRLGIALPNDRLAESRREVYPVRWGTGYSLSRFAAQPAAGDPELSDFAHAFHFQVGWDALQRIAFSADLGFLLVPTDAEQSGALDIIVAYRHPFYIDPRPRYQDDGMDTESRPRLKRRDDEEAPDRYFPLEARVLLRVNQMHKSVQSARSLASQAVTQGTGYSSAAIGLGVAYRAQDPFTVGLDFRWYRTFDDTYGLKATTTLSALRQAYGIANGQWLHSLPRWEFESWMHWKPAQNWRLEVQPRVAALTSDAGPEAFDLGVGGDLEVTYRWTRKGHWDESFRGWALSFGGSFGIILASTSQIAAAGSAGVSYSF